MGGITLNVVPAWMDVTLTTAGFNGETFRDVMVCRAVTSCAAATTGSTRCVRCGAVTTFACQFDREELCSSHHSAFGDMKPANRFVIVKMERKRLLHFWAFKHAVPHHHQCAAQFFAVRSFFGGLEAKFDGACQAVPAFI